MNKNKFHRKHKSPKIIHKSLERDKLNVSIEIQKASRPHNTQQLFIEPKKERRKSKKKKSFYFQKYNIRPLSLNK